MNNYAGSSQTFPTNQNPEQLSREFMKHPRQKHFLQHSTIFIDEGVVMAANIGVSTSSQSDQQAAQASAAAIALDFERGSRVVRHNVAWSAGAGILPFPVFDLVAVTGIQLKMISELCDVYGVPFSNSIARPIVISLIGSLGAGILAPVFAVTTFKLLPGIGTLLSGTSLAITSGAITYAVGHLFLEHFNAGGTLEDFNLIGGRRIFKSKFQEGVKAQENTKAS